MLLIFGRLFPADPTATAAYFSASFLGGVSGCFIGFLVGWRYADEIAGQIIFELAGKLLALCISYIAKVL